MRAGLRTHQLGFAVDVALFEIDALLGKIRKYGQRCEIALCLIVIAARRVEFGLRLREGVAANAFADRFGVDLIELLGETGAWLISMRLLERDGMRLRVAAEHQLITNEILVRLSEPLRDPQARRDTSASQIAAR